MIRKLEVEDDIQKALTLAASAGESASLGIVLRLLPPSPEVWELARRAVHDRLISYEQRVDALYYVMSSKASWSGEEIASLVESDEFPSMRGQLIYQLARSQVGADAKLRAIHREIHNASRGMGISDDAVACLLTCGNAESASFLVAIYDQSVESRKDILCGLRQFSPTSEQTSMVVEILRKGSMDSDRVVVIEAIRGCDYYLSRLHTLSEDPSQVTELRARLVDIVSGVRNTDPTVLSTKERALQAVERHGPHR